MTVLLTSERLHIAVAARGAELQRIHSPITNLDYLWPGDARFWNRRAPLLFPIVGALRHNAYRHQGRTYCLPRHGFARDQQFDVLQHDAVSATFVLHSQGRFREQYPFDFSLYVSYQLADASLKVTYEVLNPGAATMYFSIGAHPAFRLPLTADTRYDDWYLAFEQPQTLDRWLLNEEGLLAGREPFLQQESIIRLSKPLFYRDALILQPQTSSVMLKSDRAEHGLRLDFPEFPYLGIWAAPDADFVCLEPWHGHADPVWATGNLDEKPGMISLPPGQRFAASWSAVFF